VSAVLRSIFKIKVLCEKNIGINNKKLGVMPIYFRNRNLDSCLQHGMMKEELSVIVRKRNTLNRLIRPRTHCPSLTKNGAGSKLCSFDVIVCTCARLKMALVKVGFMIGEKS